MNYIERDTVRAAVVVVGVLPSAVRLALLTVLLLASVVGCTAGWVDYRTDYVPSPNVCRVDEIPTPDRACEVRR